MCCFTQPVRHVSGTKIFARPTEHTRQLIVYSMTIDADEDLAMVLPLPVKSSATENEVEFIELKSYEKFFDDMEKGFPIHANDVKWVTNALPAAAIEKLKVVTVGNFEASFVPTVGDFARLDKRFRLPPGTWSKLPAYKTYGFAVFKLKAGEHRFHPMAFSFPRKDARKLFFPTVHIHDGKVHEEADFDHALYAQATPFERPATFQWTETDAQASRFMSIPKSKGIVVPDEHCYKHELRGTLRNQDTFLNTHA